MNEQRKRVRVNQPEKAGRSSSSSDNEGYYYDSGPDWRDGSRDLYVVREEGRFGSYPIHDDYSDESFPD